jgi:hypothetical protein
MGPKPPASPRRWFLYAVAGLFVILSLGIILAGLMLMRQGMVLRKGVVFGSSMEPHFVGPRWVWRCSNCETEHRFAKDTVRLDQPTKCPACQQMSMESPHAEDAESTGVDSLQIESGETIQYARLRAMRTLRKAKEDPGIDSQSGLKRGDVVVLQTGADSTKEIKRLVGLPNEHLAIQEGELFVNGQQYSKSLDDALRQSILVHSVGKTEPHPQQTVWEMSIDNRLACNAHDSHSIIVARDIGIALQIDPQEPRWNISVTMETASRNNASVQIQLSIKKSDHSISLDIKDQSRTLQLAQLEALGNWIIVYHVDGFLLVGDEHHEWLRQAIEPTEDTDRNRETARIHVEFGDASSPYERLLIFRDIEWRGVLDSSSQEWPSEPGIVVLGDNVSASSDSRDRWSERPGLDAVKGVVIEPRNPMESLLHQQSN